MDNTWHRYRLSWRLASPLHIGYRTIGTIARTRLWVPGKNVWGALVDALGTQWNGDYPAAQQQVNDAMRFEAAFLGPAPNQAWCPCWHNDGLRYGYLPEREMQHLVLGANVSTAIEHGANVAAEQMLFETEYIAPRTLHRSAEINKGIQLWLVGHVWIDTAKVETVASDAIRLQGTSLKSVLATISLGGERGKGYGRLDQCTLAADDHEHYQMDADQLIIAAHAPFPLLVHARQGDHMRGMVEPIVGRNTTKESNQYGGSLTSAQFCWLPGSISDTQITLQLPSKQPGIGIFPSE